VVSKMGKALFLGLVLAIIATSVGCSDEGQPIDESPIAGTVVTFPDSNLEIAVREAIGKLGGPIYTSELEGLSFLSATRRDITDLTGLEYTNLTHLSLAYNQVSDISPLASLTNLTWLDLAHNQVSDISPLASLIDLTTLHLSYNAISGVSPLASLTNLTWLSLGENQVSDISPLASLTNLTWLSLAHNQVSDISPLAPLINLTHLGLDLNRTSDIFPQARAR